MTSVDLSSLDVSNVTSMRYMFGNCSSLTSVDMSGMNTSKVTNMSYMFYNCSSLANVDMNGLDTANVTDVLEMFSGCNNLGRIATSKVMAEGVSIELPAIFEDSEKNIVGEITSVHCDKILVRNDDIKKYLIRYVLNGGTNSSKNPGSYIEDRETVILQAPTKNGYTFKGWYSDENLTQEVTEISKGSTGDVILYAKWTKATYKITYKLNGGKNSAKNPSSYTITTSTITLKSPTKAGYTFVGWYSDKNLTKRVTKIKKGSTGNITLYAKWQKVSDNSGDSDTGSSGTGSSGTGNNGTSDSFPEVDEQTATTGMFGESNGFRWTYDKENHSLTITGEDKGINELTSCLPKAVLSNTKKIVFENCVVVDGSMSYMFGGFRDNLTSVDMSGLDTSGVTDMSNMFYWSSSLTSVDMSGLNTSKVTDMSDMFSWCNSLTSVDMSGLDTSSVTDMSYMFTSCDSLLSVDMNGLDTSSVTDMSYMFTSCDSLLSVNMGGLDISSVTDISYMFSGCKNLEYIATPYVITEGVCIELPNPLEDSQKNIVSEITSAQCNKILAKEYDTTKYFITYCLNGGINNSNNPESYTKYNKTIILRNPTRVGYTFEGWYSDENYNAKITEIKTGSIGDVTLYAKWTVNKYNIVFCGNGSTSGSMTSLSDCNYGSDYTLTENIFERTGCTFTGWNTKADGSGTSYVDKANIRNLATNDGSSVILYAQWEIINYTITYHLNGGMNSNENPEGYVVTDENITLKDPSRTGYTFGGWYSDTDFTEAVTEIPAGSIGDREFYAKWTANKYNIVFDGNGSTGGSMEAMSGCNYDSDYVLSANAFEKNGYEFTGWNTKADGSGTAYEDKASVSNLTSTNESTVTLYAQWEEVEYSITYDLDGGENNVENPESYTVTTESIALQTPSKNGYTFAGWYSDSEYTEAVTEIVKGSVGNITLYAKWNIVNYDITYNLNGGENNAENPAGYTVITEEITLQTPGKTGYTFAGWYSDSECTEKVESIPTGSTGAKTFYAKWTANTYTINFDGNGSTSGSMEAISNCNYDSSYVLTTNTFERTDYIFIGWNTKADGSGITYADKASISNLTSVNGSAVTLYAQWEEVEYVITYELNGGENNSNNPDSYTKGGGTIKLQEPSKAGYTFKGWYSDKKCTKKVTKIKKGSTGNITLYAKWSIETYDITYKLNGGKNSSKNPANYKVTTPTIKLQKPSRTGYAFKGWYSDKKCTKKVTKIKKGSTGNKTLYAKWKKK